MNAAAAGAHTPGHDRPRLFIERRARSRSVLPSPVGGSLRLPIVDVKYRFHGDYVTSAAKQAVAAHLIRHEDSGLLYYPELGEARAKIWTHCGVIMRHNNLSVHSEVPLGFHECAKCRERYGV